MQVYRIPIDQDSRMEMTRHGTEGFPMAIYETVLAKNALGFVDWHWHDEFQFCLVTEGQVRFHVGNGVHLLAAGMGLFINSGVLHMAKPLTANAAYHCMDVSPKLMGSFPGSDIHSRYLKRFLEDPTRRYILLSKDVPWQSLVLEKMGEIYRVYRERAEGFEIWIVSLLMHIFFSASSKRCGRRGRGGAGYLGADQADPQLHSWSFWGEDYPEAGIKMGQFVPQRMLPLLQEPYRKHNFWLYQ